MLRSFGIILTASFLLSAGIARGTTSNLIKNGGFDVGPRPSSYMMLPKGSTAIPGWVVVMGTVDIIGPSWHDADGGQNSIDLDGTPGPGAIAQTFATSRGGKYMVSFALGSNPDCGPTVKHLLVTVGGARRQYAFDSSGMGESHMGWQTKSFPFTAARSRSTLTFTSLDPQGGLCGPAVDAVHVWKVK